MKLTSHKVIRGTILCESGLHIGGSQEQMEIGGVDLPIIKHPISGAPYIPGSSLKGKMRSQLEKIHGKVSPNKNGDLTDPCRCGKEDCLICRVFGAHMNPNHKLGSTRIMVRDAKLSKETKDEYDKIVKEKGTSYLEKKTENIINRMTGTAEHPRSQERVPEGAKFDLEITIQLFDIDKEKEAKIIDLVKQGLKLVQDSYLGGFGSRGSGQVSFNDLKIDGTPTTL